MIRQIVLGVSIAGFCALPFSIGLPHTKTVELAEVDSDGNATGNTTTVTVTVGPGFATVSVPPGTDAVAVGAFGENSEEPCGFEGENFPSAGTFTVLFPDCPPSPKIAIVVTPGGVGSTTTAGVTSGW